MELKRKQELQAIAATARKSALAGIYSANSGHPGGSFSAMDTFVYLYCEEMNIDPKNPKMADRDRFVLSKGHCCPGLYAVLAEVGYFPKEEMLN